MPRHCIFRGFHVTHPGWSSVCGWASKWKQSETDALNADRLQWNSDCFFVSLRIARLLVSSRRVHICNRQFCGLHYLEQPRENSLGGHPEPGKDAGCENTSDRHFESVIQSATSHLLCNTQRNCSCLRARLLYSERQKFTWRIVCQGIRQSRWDDILPCTWAVLTIFQSLHFTILCFTSPVSWHTAWTSHAFSHLIFICSPVTCIVKRGVHIAGDQDEGSEIIYTEWYI